MVTGIKGWDDGKTYKVKMPDMPSAVVINGGTLHLDVTEVDNDTYTLIDVDSVSGAFDAVTATGNSDSGSDIYGILYPLFTVVVATAVATTVAVTIAIDGFFLMHGKSLC